MYLDRTLAQKVKSPSVCWLLWH